ncbi:hypothetical protein chiPu_0003566 [Chiloscyllium punctatum]|uniref:Uncharacterized protein n=1 Tax=Chiloscyllium punctatum TaxID=137246 RepID=A0A401S452_CHIPU|nr:hypothetical protein [Chiloscyllium punctatum]
MTSLRENPVLCASFVSPTPRIKVATVQFHVSPGGRYSGAVELCGSDLLTGLEGRAQDAMPFRLAVVLKRIASGQLIDLHGGNRAGEEEVEWGGGRERVFFKCKGALAQGPKTARGHWLLVANKHRTEGRPDRIGWWRYDGDP